MRKIAIPLVLVVLPVAAIVGLVLAWPTDQSPQAESKRIPGTPTPTTPSVVTGKDTDAKQATPRPVRANRAIRVASLPVDALLPVVCDASYTPTTRNDAANRLLNQGDRQLAGRLIRMLRDKTEDLTWRNYCIQFLRGCYEQQTKQPTTTWALLGTVINLQLLTSDCPQIILMR